LNTISKDAFITHIKDVSCPANSIVIEGLLFKVNVRESKGKPFVFFVSDLKTPIQIQTYARTDEKVDLSEEYLSSFKAGQ
jgi:DNA polymerase III alpha subunit (gram-positive type)